LKKYFQQFGDVLIQLGLHKVLKENIIKMDTVKWEELDLRVSTTIYTSLAKNVLGTSSIKELWEKLE
jgi:hypothetical protein